MKIRPQKVVLPRHLCPQIGEPGVHIGVQQVHSFFQRVKAFIDAPQFWGNEILCHFTDIVDHAHGLIIPPP